MNGFWDRLGFSTSILCILHCLATPIMVMIAPLAGHTLAHGWFHWLIALIVIPIALWALWNGYRLHNDKRVLWIGSCGMGAVFLSLALGYQNSTQETEFMVAGGTLLATAHLLNLRKCRGR